MRAREVECKRSRPYVNRYPVGRSSGNGKIGIGSGLANGDLTVRGGGQGGYGRCSPADQKSVVRLGGIVMRAVQGKNDSAGRVAGQNLVGSSAYARNRPARTADRLPDVAVVDVENRSIGYEEESAFGSRGRSGAGIPKPVPLGDRQSKRPG